MYCTHDNDHFFPPYVQPLTAEDKKTQTLAQKKAFDDRFVSFVSSCQRALSAEGTLQKKRGKRPLPPREEEETDSAKKPKRELSTDIEINR